MKKHFYCISGHNPSLPPQAPIFIKVGTHVHFVPLSSNMKEFFVGNQ
jgi:hypothetical protein